MPDDALRQWLTRAESDHRRPGITGMITRHVSSRVIAAGRAAATTAALPSARKKLRGVAGTGEPIRLHLGCGFAYKDGWVNLDLAGANVDVLWDLRRGIPFPDNSVDAIFHEHLLEHLPMKVGLAVTDECYRVLKPGGVLRAVLPDAGRLVRAYNTDEPWLTERCPTKLIAVQAMFYDFGHVAMYDAETLIALHRSAGFSEVTEQQFGESWLATTPDSPERAFESLYVDARK